MSSDLVCTVETITKKSYYTTDRFTSMVFKQEPDVYTLVYISTAATPTEVGPKQLFYKKIVIPPDGGITIEDLRHITAPLQDGITIFRTAPSEITIYGSP